MSSKHKSGAHSLGIDFGTTNSSVALAHTDGRVKLLSFADSAALTESFRSVIYIEQSNATVRTRMKSFTGPSAVERYLNAEEGYHSRGRLIQSLKSHLSCRTLTGTEVFGKHYSLEDLIARILTDLRLAAEQHFSQLIRHATVGRPVRFVGAETNEADTFALTRLRSAFAQAGFESVTFEMEPVAAAHSYEATLDRDELILIGDFGGGTSDFSLLRVGPQARAARASGTFGLLGNAGLGLAGDSFDARIIRKLVSPALGADSYERQSATVGINGPKLIPAVPAWIYANLERWHYLSFLKTRNVAEILRGARARADEPQKIAALITLIEEDLGYQLHQAVERLKLELSRATSARFRFHDGSMEIEANVTRSDFERWIAADLTAIETCVDGLLDSTHVAPESVDRVFLTGGTSFVPAVRRIFTQRFPDRSADNMRIVTGDEFTSVARGLALAGVQS
jgi:hypothetical chaperone protein